LIAFLEDEEDEAYRRYREIAPDWRGRWVAHMLKVYSKLGLTHHETRGINFPGPAPADPTPPESVTATNGNVPLDDG
jgi:hypothetical protein